jgi:mono/diheme cytochrome c family protein
VNGHRLSLAFAVAVLAACSRKTTPAQPPPLDSPSAVKDVAPGYEVRLGHDVFTHYCATCHGDSGAGDGFNAYNLDPHPRDLSDPAFQSKKTDAELADTIRRGGAGVGLSNLMPPWGRTLTERQVGEVVMYVRTLKKSSAP